MSFLSLFFLIPSFPFRVFVVFYPVVARFSLLFLLQSSFHGTKFAMVDAFFAGTLHTLWRTDASPYTVLVALGTFLALSFMFRFVFPFSLRRLALLARYSRMTFDDVVVSSLQHIPAWTLQLFSLFFALSLLPFPSAVHSALRAGVLLILIVILVTFSQRFLEFILVKHVPGLSVGSGNLPTVLRATLALILWTFGLLLLLSNLGINVISLVTGLGIGGIAVALAVQNILSDMFSSFALYFDKPFREGDFIIVGSHMGVVKNIGLKTTRVQALQGEEIVISNQELTSSRIQNFKRMDERRVQFRFGVTYDATSVQLRMIPDMVKRIVSAHDNARFDRAHFAQFGDSSLDFEVVYYVLTNDYNAYMDVQQEINLALYEALHVEGLSFAFPTRTVHVLHDRFDAR